MNTVSDIHYVHCMSIAFDGLAIETKFIRTNLMAFMKGASNTVAMTDCNHAAKNMRLQLVLGSKICNGRKCCF